MKTYLKNILFISACCVAVVFDGYSAPTIKKLGVANNNVNNVVKPTAVNRAGSLHGVKNVTVKPVQVIKTTGNAETARLSVGKYLHGAGVASGKIRPINNTNTSIVDASVEEKILNLTNKIEILEAKIENMQPKISVQDNDASDGRVVKSMTINDDNVIELNKTNVKIPVGDADADVAAAIWVEQD